MSDLSRALLKWYDAHGRKTLPWSNPRTPYRVWISEIMLQQTQVETVIPYFKRFMKAFPSIKALADAPQEAVMTHWAGLGYYARARNLHKAAQMIRSEFAGRMPDDLEALQRLPGIGRSTAGAIRSLAFDAPAAILDGNVKRVLSRYHARPGWPDARENLNALWDIASQHLPQKRFGDYTQALMDLGATLCTRTQPQCGSCPLKKSCVAHAENLQDEIPAARPKKKLPQRNTHWLILRAKQDILLIQRPQTGIWGGLWAFPEWESYSAAQAHAADLNPDALEVLASFNHTFTHFKLSIHPMLVHLSKKPAVLPDNWTPLWYNKRHSNACAVPKPVAHVMKQL